jgi:hypothetical protein
MRDLKARDTISMASPNEPWFMELQVRTRKIITPEDIAFLESQPVSQQK